MKKYHYVSCIPIFLLSVSINAADVLKSATTSDLEKELASRNTREKRIETTEANLKKLVNRKSVKKAVIGSVITGAITAHPVGLLVGGLVGAFVGRAEKYEKVEEKIAEMEQDIIVDEDDFLTGEELRLADFASGNESVITVFEDPEEGVFDDSEIAASAPAPENYQAATTANNLPKITVANRPPSSNVNNSVAKTSRVDSNQLVAANQKITTAVMPTSKPNPLPTPANSDAVFGGAQVASLALDQSVPVNPLHPREKLESCYKRGDAKTTQASRRQEVKAMSHCFYMMY